jgi:hypothetical protein
MKEGSNLEPAESGKKVQPVDNNGNKQTGGCCG